MRGFIMLPAVVIILLTTYFTMKSATKPRRNVVFGVTLPSEAIYDIRIQESIIEYSKKIKLYILISTIIIIPMFFMPNSIETVYLLVWAFFVSGWVQYYPYKIMNKRVKAIKQEEQWYVGDKKIATIDTKLSRLKSKMPISDKYMIIPILISIIPMVMSFSRAEDNFKYLIPIAIFNTIMLIAIYIHCFRGTNKVKLVVYSEDSNINYCINKESKYLKSIMWFIQALVSSIISLLIYFQVFEVINIGYGAITVIVIICPFFLVAGSYYINKRLRDLEDELNKIDTQPIYVDDDQYWINGYKYYNENDTSVSVNSRYGTGITYNLATKKGKFFNYGIITIVGIILIPVCISLVAMDFSKPKITISENLGKVNVKYPIYNFEFNTEDIEHIKVVDEVKFKLRTNGIGTSTYSRGDFSSNDYGKCRVYIYNDSKPYIVVKLKDKYFIYNENNKENTMRVYEDLKNTMS